MIKYNKILGLLFVIALGFVGCQKDSLPQDTSVDRRIKLLGHADDPTDQWIKKNMIDKYNIDPVWRWTFRLTNYGKNLVPPYEENVVPFLKVIDNAFLDVYVTVRGKDFLNTYVPKQLLLIGSNSFNPDDGTVTLGQAEGGRKIILFGVNNWKNRAQLGSFLHTMYHEFSHILHQTKLYPNTYQMVTPSGYTSQWFNDSEEKALEKGFISPYAQLNKNEDFVEMIAFYVTLSPQEWEARINSMDGSVTYEKTYNDAKQEGKSDEEADNLAKNVAFNTVRTAKAALATKLSIIKEYLQTQWNIDLDHLRDVAQERISHLDDPTAVHSALMENHMVFCTDHYTNH